MAMGSTANQNIGTVKSTCKGLEVSPSKSSGSSPIYHGGSKATGKGVSEHTGKFASAGKTTRPNPKGTKTGFGKKNLMAGKSRGR